MQNDKQISYAEAFGAFHPDGSKELYTYVPGDQIRVLYYEEINGTVYPNNVIFDIIDQVLLTDNTTDTPEEGLNPLDSNGSNTPLFLQGSFIVVRNNPEAQGFNWQSVSTQGNEFQEGNAQSNWNKNCIVELLRPSAATDPDSRAYRDTGLVFNVGRGTGQQGTVGGVYHQVPTIFMQNGDVWWRRVPVNLAEYDETGQYYPSLIRGVLPDAGAADPYQPRFRNVYLECRSFTDTFPLANVDGFGKARFYFPESAEVRRDSSIIYSDRNDYAIRRLQYSSFNPFQFPFTDLPNRYGPINALVEFDEYVLVIQEDKCSILPINRSILSDASGGNQLIDSTKIIGKQKFISGNYGADSNRESVLKVNEDVYFAHKTKGQVYRYRGGKIEVVSKKGIQGYIYDTFRDNLALATPMRVVSGYDSLKDEYILSIINIGAFAQYDTLTPFTQPFLEPFVFNPFADVTVDGTTFEDVGGSGGGVIPDIAGDEDWDNGYSGPIDDLVDDIVDNSGAGPISTPGDFDPSGTGVSPTESTNANADYIKDFLEGKDPEPNGGGQGFDAVAIKVFIENELGGVGDFVNDAPPPRISMSSVIPATISTLAKAAQSPNAPVVNFTINSDVNDTTWSYDVTTNEIIVPFGYTTALDAFNGLSVSNTWIDGPITTPVNYEIDYLNNGPTAQKTLRGLFSADEFFFRDKTGVNIQQSKALETSLSTFVKGNLSALLNDVELDLTNAGLLTNPTIANLLQQAKGAYDELVDYLANDLQDSVGAPLEFIGLNNPDVTATGFGLFQADDYPLTDFAVFTLNNIKTLKNNLGDYVRPLLTLEDVDVSEIVSSLGSEAASLRSQVDVLTSQVQNLSSAPENSAGVTFIPGVEVNQLQDRARTNLAGEDGVLTREDVITRQGFEDVIVNIIDLYSSSSVTITPDLVKEVIKQYYQQIVDTADETGLGGAGGYFGVFPEGADPVLAPENRVRALARNPTDINVDGFTTTADLIDFLIFFGDENAPTAVTQENLDERLDEIATQITNLYA